MTKSKATVADDIDDYPQSILSTWSNHHEALRSIEEVQRRAKAKDAELEAARKRLQELTVEYADLGTAETAFSKSAAAAHSMVTWWCEQNEMPLPPVPVAPQSPARDPFEFDDDPKAWTDPAGRVWDLTRDYVDQDDHGWRYAGGFGDERGTGLEPLFSRVDWSMRDVPLGVLLHPGLTLRPVRVTGPLEIPVTRIADVRVANGHQETREQPAVDPLEPLAPGVIDSRADVTTPDADKEATDA